MWLALGGFVCGFLAGAAARFGRLCSMSALEDALIGRDFRAAKAWGLALGLAILITQLLTFTLSIDLETSVYAAERLDLFGALLGGLLFGLGMAWVGTCSFGLIVRAGSGDLRAAVSLLIVGVSAFALTAGLLAPVRLAAYHLMALDRAELGGALIPTLVAKYLDRDLGAAIPTALAAGLVLVAATDERLRRRPRLILAALGLGMSVGGGWLVTAISLNEFETSRLESLSFVAPVGRALLQLMSETMRDVGFGVASVFGVLAGALAVAALKEEARWEAFDDVREMRRHLLGAILMGFGGVLARGCTIGQGMSAASALAISAPIFALGILLGAKIGLSTLLEGRALWRLGPPY
jgi:uncharacterized membrane protein YedE/YeeE